MLVHLQSVKGKGLGPQIENTFEAHAVSPSQPKAPGAPARKSWTQVFSEGLHELMARDEKVVALTAAMQSNTGLAPLAEAFPGASQLWVAGGHYTAILHMAWMPSYAALRLGAVLDP